jgi:hypothetical protein
MHAHMLSPTLSHHKCKHFSLAGFYEQAVLEKDGRVSHATLTVRQITVIYHIVRTLQSNLFYHWFQLFDKQFWYCRYV